jgi:hypothetical protein
MSGGGAQAAVRAPDAELYLVFEFERRAYRVADSFTIGRDTGSDLIVLEPTVSRTHARIVADEGGFALENVGPTGTRVNGLRLEQAHPLAYGDRIEIGTAVFTVRTAPLPLGVTVVDRDKVRMIDAVAARRPTIRHPLMTERPVEPRRNWGTWIAVVVGAALILAALLKG